MNTGNERTTPRGAWAASMTKQIEATYRDIKIVLFGNEITPTDVNGNPVEPVIIDGTTYRPLRGVLESLGYEVR